MQENFNDGVLFAGFDCGGSQTRCAIYDRNGRKLGCGRGGPSNYLFCGKTAAGRAVAESLTSSGVFPASGAHFGGVFIASASCEVGCGEAQLEFWRDSLRAAGAVFEDDSVWLDSDIVPVWYGAGGGRPGAALICGTGSVAYYLSGEVGELNFCKAGGWGPLLGDEGSGYDLGRQALRLAAEMTDGVIPRDDEFAAAIFGFYSVDASRPRSLISKFSLDERRNTAACASAVEKLAALGNRTAQRLFDVSAERLAAMAKRVIKLSGEETAPLAVSGGLLSSPGQPMSRALLALLEGDAAICQVIFPALPASEVCAALALKRAGLDAESEKIIGGI